MPHQDRRRAIRFDLIDLLAATFAVAVGGAAWSYSHDWRSAELAFIGAVFAVALTHQARDLWDARAVLRGSPEGRHTLWFPLGWRLAAAGLLLFVVFLRSVPAPTADEFYVGDVLQGRDAADGALLLLMTAVLLAGWIAYRDAESAGPRSRWRNASWWCSAAVMAMLSAASVLLLYALVHVAIHGILAARPAARPGAVLEPAFVTNRELSAFARWSYVACAAVLLNVVLTVRLAASGAGAPWRRAAWSLLVLTSLTWTGVYLVWAYRAALPRVSPIFTQLLLDRPARDWVYAAIMVGALATAATWRLLQQRATATCRLPILWQQRSSRTWHEHTLLLALLAGWTGEGLRNAAQLGQLLRVGTDFLEWWADFAYAALGEPIGLLRTACLLTVGFVLRRRWQRKPPAAPVLIGLPPAHFTAVWLAVTATIVTAVPTLAIFGFAVWLDPWW